MNLFVDDDLCIGCGMCAGIEPAVYRMKDDGLAERFQEITPQTEESAKQAMEMCPVNAIKEED